MGYVTKQEVKMARYWPASFFVCKMAAYWPRSFSACLWAKMDERSRNLTKKSKANIQPSRPNKLGQ